MPCLPGLFYCVNTQKSSIPGREAASGQKKRLPASSSSKNSDRPANAKDCIFNIFLGQIHFLS